MRAMIIRQIGGPEVFEEVDLPVPQPGVGEVRIKLAYAGVNQGDCKNRAGLLAPFDHKYAFPYLLGFEGAGVVDQVGAGVEGLKVGDRVITCSNHVNGAPGTYAEYVAVPVGKVAPLPDTISFEQGVSIPISGMTAWQAIKMRAGIAAGQRVLIHGGSGAVGSYAIQFAKALGAEVATTCSARKMDYVKNLGADIVIDYQREDVHAAVMAWNPDGLDAVIDAVSCGTLPTALNMLKKGGVLISIATLDGDGDVEGDTRRAEERGLRKIFAVCSHDHADVHMSEIVTMLETGQVVTPPVEVLPLEKMAEAHSRVEQGSVFVKMIVKIADL